MKAVDVYHKPQPEVHSKMLHLADVVSLFNQALGVEFEARPEVRAEGEKFLAFLDNGVCLENDRIETLLIADINSKFRLNGEGIAHFFGFAARRGTTFNYHEKRAIASAFDSGDRAALSTIVNRRLPKETASELLSEARWIQREETLGALHRELKSPTLTRKDSKPRDWSQEILEGLFTGVLANAFGNEAVHRFNDPVTKQGRYEPDFWLYLQQRYPRFYSDKPRLVVLNSTPNEDENALLHRVQAAYNALPEFGHLAVLLTVESGYEWGLVGQITLYAEKHIRRTVHNGYFRKEDVKASTLACVQNVDEKAAKFHIWNDGFYFQDCFVVEGGPLRLVLLLQKREANETPFPCPSCRSLRVQGNSYPLLGVKSWECTNIICAGKSKFGRGKRYSFVQLLKQAAIEEPDNEIPPVSVRGWLRDVQPARTVDEIVEMLVRHYSLAGDRILVDSRDSATKEMFGRKLWYHPVSKDAFSESTISPEDFFDSEWFSRYDVGESDRDEVSSPHVVTLDSLTAFQGDAGVALRALSSGWIDGAVTSPPYYNARDYSLWENIYCYLHDMRRVNSEVFRVLKPGGHYLYNIFDYFDNENTVALSAMGEKRLTLSAYTIDLFRRIGFECVGNVVWDKGDIEGKRGFNSGNYSPFYQAPFNCWEHILVFRKPGPSTELMEFPTVLRQSPVIKMISGRNVHGHTAPFPEAIPALLASRLPRGATILDPFAGSMTTAIAAVRAGSKAICVEKDAEYFALGLRKYRESVVENLVLF